MIDNYLHEVSNESDRIKENLTKYQNFLGLPSIDIEGKISPSVISRSDTSILAIEGPRFAARAYLDEGKNTFINLRRMNRMSEKLPARWADLEGGDKAIVGLEPSDTLPKDLLQSQSYIGDSVFEVPKTILKDYHVVCSNIGHLYGENSTTDTCKQIPFIQNFTLSGICSQVSVFLSSILMHSHASNVYGLAELTALTRQYHQSQLGNGFFIDGLNIAGVVEATKATGLRCSPQCAHPEMMGAHSIDIEKQTIESLCSYIKSNIPVIFPVNHKKLYETGVYEQLTQQWKLKKEMPDELHMITIIGVNKETENQGHERKFLCIDSSTVPFLVISESELLKAACRLSEINNMANDLLRDIPNLTEGDSVYKLCESPLILPVVPHKVRTSLIQPYPVKTHLAERYLKKNRRGLLYYVNNFVSNLKGDHGNHLPFEWNVNNTAKVIPNRFKLKQVCLKTIKAMRSNKNSWFNGKIVSSKIEHGDESIWVWEHHFGGRIWFWNAEALCEPNSSFLNMCVCTCETTTTANQTNNLVIKPHEEPEKILSALPNITPALITSYSTNGFNNTLKDLPKDCHDIELYTFMRNDVSVLFPKQFHNCSSIEAMSIASSDEQIIREIAEKIQYYIDQERRKKSIKIRAIASYLPGIVSSWNGTQDQDSIHALCFVTQLAQCLNQELGHDVKTIEIVGGQKIRRVSLVMSPDEYSGKLIDLLAINFHDNSKLKDNFMTTMDTVLNRCEDIGFEGNYALELEPGPLYWLRNIGVLEDLLYSLDLLGDKYRSRIGINVDIGHWGCLLKHPSNILDQEIFRNKIAHAHINDHSKGHFTDLIPNTLHDKYYYYDWLEKLDKLTNNKNSMFDGIVSLELEALNDKEKLINGWTYFKQDILCK